MVDKDHLNLLKKGVKVWNDWRKNNPEVVPDLTGAKFGGRNLRDVDFSRTKLKNADLSRANLKNAELDEANLIEANLDRADLRFAGLKDSDLRNANLGGAKLNGASLLRTNFQLANLSKAIFVEAHIIQTNFHLANLSYANLEKANLVGVVPSQKLIGFWTNIGDANFAGANLKLANLSGQNVSGQSFQEADLSEANLTRIEALGTNFTNALLTGACVEDWHINNQTNLSNVACSYIYLKENKKERRPHDPNRNFVSGEFTTLFQKALETVDLIFINGINWQAFLSSFQKLQIECCDRQLNIEAIEQKSGGIFVVRIKVPHDASKAEVEKRLKREYEIQLKAIEDRYRLELNAKNNEIEIYKQKSTDILELAKLAASRPINISQTQSNNMAGDRNINIDRGNYNEKIEGNYMQGNSYSITGDNNQAVQGDNNQVTQENRRDTNAGEEITQAEAIELLAELERKIASSELPEETRTKTISRLNAISEDAKEAKPDKQLVAGNLKRVTENLSQATKATEEGKKLWREVFPMLKTVGTWVGLAGSFFSNLL